MAKVTEKMGPFVKVPACLGCGWYWRPMRIFNPPHNGVCRECGEYTKETVGRFKIKITKTWFSTENEFIGFEPKEVAS